MNHALASVSLLAVFAAGCGDGSLGDRGTDVAEPTRSGGASAGPAPSEPPPPGPAIEVPRGSVALRAANFLASPIDYCIRGEGEPAWSGPVFRKIAQRAIAAGQITERSLLKNARFSIRLIGGASTSCDDGVAAPDVALGVLPEGSPITLVFAQEPGRAVAVKALVDETQAASSAVSLIRFVHVASLGARADLVLRDDAADVSLFKDAPFLGSGTSDVGISPRGFVPVEPLPGRLVTLKSMAQPIIVSAVVTRPGASYSLFSLGTREQPTLLFCADSEPESEHLSKCNVLAGLILR